MDPWEDAAEKRKSYEVLRIGNPVLLPPPADKFVDGSCTWQEEIFEFIGQGDASRNEVRARFECDFTTVPPPIPGGPVAATPLDYGDLNAPPAPPATPEQIEERRKLWEKFRNDLNGRRGFRFMPGASAIPVQVDHPAYRVPARDRLLDFIIELRTEIANAKTVNISPNVGPEAARRILHQIFDARVMDAVRGALRELRDMREPASESVRSDRRRPDPERWR